MAGESLLLTTLCGVGLCVLGIWLAHGMVKPSKFKLSGSPGRANKLTPAHVVLLYLGSVLGAMLVAMGLGAALGFDEKSIEASIIAGAALPLIGLTGALVVASYAFDNGIAGGMGLTARRWANDSIRSVVGYLAIIPVCILLMFAAHEIASRWRPDLMPPHPFLQILKGPGASQSWRIALIFTSVVLAPIGEEVIFRGLLQSMFRRYLKSPWMAIIFASVVFAGIHVLADVKSLPALFALSLALGYNYERTGRLLAPILIHMIFNAVMITVWLTN